MGDCHLFDEEEFDIVLWIVVGIEGIEERGEASAGFVREKDGLKEEGLAPGVTASGSGGVDAVGGALAVGDGHTLGNYTGWVKGLGGYVVGFVEKKSVKT